MTSAEPSGDEGSIEASARGLSDAEATRLAEKVVGMYDVATKLDAVDEYRKDAQEQARDS